MSLETTYVIQPNGLMHNHITRDIRPFGICPSCDRFHFTGDRGPEWLAQVPGAIGLVTITGSHAHGCATPSSDMDYRGFFIYQSAADLLSPFAQRHENFHPTGHDVALHEVGKFIRLATKGNPTVIEAIASPLVLLSSPLAEAIRENIDAFLSNAVRSPYIGAINSQLQVVHQNLGPYVSRTPEKGRKAARNALLLIEQIVHLLETGEVRVTSPDPSRWVERAERTVEEIDTEINAGITSIAAMQSVLPDAPDIPRITEMVLSHLSEMLLVALDNTSPA